MDLRREPLLKGLLVPLLPSDVPLFMHCAGGKMAIDDHEWLAKVLPVLRAHGHDQSWRIYE